MFERGYTKLGTLWRIPLRVHFSIAFGLLYVSGLRFDPGAWLGYLVVVLGHELGHAVLVRGYGLRVFSIEMHAFGGACWHEPARTKLAESVIAWGGVLAQMVLLAAALAITAFAPAGPAFLGSFWNVLISVNLLIAAINLLPLHPLDGARAWQLPKLLLARRRKKAAVPKRSTKKKSAREKAHAESSDAPHLRLVRDKDGDFHFEQDDEEQ